MPRSFSRLAFATLAVGALLMVVFAGMVVRLRNEDRVIYDNAIIQRDAAELYPVAKQRLAESEAAGTGGAASPGEVLMPILLQSARQENMFGVAIFDSEGSRINASATLLLPELAPADYSRLLGGELISRYTARFPLDRYFAGMTGTAPVLEVLLPFSDPDPAKPPIGFILYYIDARKLAQELAAVDQRFNRETTTTLGVGSVLIAIVLGGAYLLLLRAQRTIAERNDRLIRANFELSLAAKASALGQITSHLIHGLQGPVAGLHAVMATRTDEGAAADWKSAADYTERLQGMIQETVALLGDTGAHTSYVLTGRDLADTIRRRNSAAAADKGVSLDVTCDFDAGLDSYRGSLVCLIATNLVQNAIAATPPGRRVDVALHHAQGAMTLFVSDQGTGISPELRPHLFEPGRSGRPGGTGLGLAISQLLARQIGASLALVESHGSGTIFRLTLPL